MRATNHQWMRSKRLDNIARTVLIWSNTMPTSSLTFRFDELEIDSLLASGSKIKKESISVALHFVPTHSAANCPYDRCILRLFESETSTALFTCTQPGYIRCENGRRVMGAAWGWGTLFSRKRRASNNRFSRKPYQRLERTCCLFQLEAVCESRAVCDKKLES
jgi:hypothetical protein